MNDKLPPINIEEAYAKIQIISDLIPKWKKQSESLKVLKSKVGGKTSSKCYAAATAYDQCADDLSFIFGIIESLHQTK